jgi:Secretion system C-terminal sorting domain
MKSKILFSLIMTFLILSYAPSSFSQNPAFTCTLANDTMVSATVYEVDIYMLSRDTASIQLAQIAMGFTVNNLITNGGTLTASFVPGSSQLTNTSQIPTAFNATTVSGGLRVIKVAAKTPPGPGNGSLISNVAPGTKLARLRLTSNVGFATAQSNIKWLFGPTTLYVTTFNAYVNGTNTLIGGTGTPDTTAAYFAVNTSNPMLPVELSSFVSNVSGREINLSWETKTEVNTRQFEIDRSLIGAKDAVTTWSPVGFIPAAGTSTTPKKYSFSEKNLQSGKYHYRLKMIDNDGSFKFSDVVESDITLPKNFELSQNYPNPFNPSTKINYSLPFDSRVSIEVYNITGEKIGEILNQEQSAGYYTANFSSSTLNRNIASGVYIYKLNAVDKLTGNAFTSIKKMMLLK